jgi:hypothetical protein
MRAGLFVGCFIICILYKRKATTENMIKAMEKTKLAFVMEDSLPRVRRVA